MGEFLGKTLGNMISNLDKIALINLPVPLAEDVLPKLATKATFFTLYKFERKISRQGDVRAATRFTLFILNEDMDDIIKIVKSQKHSDGVTETVKHKKNKNVDFWCADGTYGCFIDSTY